MDSPMSLPTLLVLVFLLLLGLVAVSIMVALRSGHVLAQMNEASRGRYDETYVLPMTDGARVELHRIKSQVSSAPPVLLVHGIATDHRHLDLTHDRSLARSLAHRGNDVWLLSMRCGLRQPRGVSEDVVRIIQMDFAAAIEKVVECTGAGTVNVLGYSLGGVVALAALADEELAGRVNRVVIIATPGYMGRPSFGDKLLGWLVMLNVSIPVSQFCLATAKWAHFIARHLRSSAVNWGNVEPVNMTRLWLGVRNISPSLMGSLLAWKRSPNTYAGGIFRFEHLGRLNQPALFVAGQADRIATPRSVRCLAERWTVGHSEFWLAGRPNCGDSYGHADLLVGRKAQSEIFEKVAGFLSSDLGKDSGTTNPGQVESPS